MGYNLTAGNSQLRSLSYTNSCSILLCNVAERNHVDWCDDDNGADDDDDDRTVVG